MSNPFTEGEKPGVVAVDEPVADENGIEVEETDVEVVEPDADVDVDAPTADDETETLPTTPAAAPKAQKAAKEPKAPARPAVPEGFISPVAAAKALSEHLSNKHGKVVEISSQMVYSYMKNNGPESKNPIPTYTEGGRSNLLKWDEIRDWWDAKEARVWGRKEAKAAKDAEKAAKAAEKSAQPATPPAPQAEVVEVE